MAPATSWSFVQSRDMCVCVCVCVRERERERERGGLETSTVKRPLSESAVGHRGEKNLPRPEHSFSQPTFKRGTSKTQFNFLAV
jgi:hypothetical protein